MSRGELIVKENFAT